MAEALHPTRNVTIHSPSAFPPPCHLSWTGGRAPLNSLWAPVGFFRSPLVASSAPPGYLLVSPGSLWLPLASFWTPLGSPWVLFGCPLAPVGLHLVSLGFHRGACGTSFGWYLGSIWVIVDSISAFFWNHFDTILVPFDNHFGAILELASFLVPFWV